MKNYETSLVADQYRVNRIDGSYKDVNNRTLVRKGMKVTTDYFEEVNSLTEVNGMMFIRDAEATEKRKNGTLNVDSNNSDSNTNTELDELRAKYKELTQKDANKLWKEGKLKSEIELLSKQD